MRAERTRDRNAGRAPVSCRGLADFGYVTRLLALGSVNNLELDRLAFFESPEAVALDRREVDEDVSAAVTFDESITLSVVEPLDLTCDTHRTFPALRRRDAEAPHDTHPRRCTQQRPWTQKKTASARPRLTVAGLSSDSP